MLARVEGLFPLVARTGWKPVPQALQLSETTYLWHRRLAGVITGETPMPQFWSIFQTGVSQWAA